MKSAKRATAPRTTTLQPSSALEFGYHLQAWESPDGVQGQHEGAILGGEALHPQLPGRHIDSFIQPRSPFTRSGPTRSGARVGEGRSVLKWPRAQFFIHF